MKSQYMDMLNLTVPEITKAEMDAAVALAFSTAGLQKRASDIQLEPASSDYGKTYRSATSSCRVWTMYYLIHILHTNLENVSM